MKIAFIAPGVHYQARPAKATAALVERLCEDHQVSVFSHTIEGIDLSKIKHYKVPAVTRPKFLAYITFLVSSTIILTALSFLRKRDFDIIHSAGCCCAFSTDVITSHFCEREGLHLEKANIIEMAHKSVLQKLKALDHRMYRRLAALVEGLVFGHNSPKACIVVSQSMKREFLRHYGDAAESIIVIPNGVNLKMFNPANRLLCRDRMRQKHGISRSELVLLFAGGDWERKGVLYLIEALSLLLRPDIKLLVIGSGDRKFYGQLAELKQFEKETECRVNFRITTWPNLPRYMEFAIYRIIREAITNVRKHAKSPKLEVELRQEPERLVIRVKDWGIGFISDKEELPSSNRSMGLLSMRRRAEFLGGTFKISGSLGKGTEIIVDIPWLSEEE